VKLARRRISGKNVWEVKVQWPFNTERALNKLIDMAYQTTQQHSGLKSAPLCFSLSSSYRYH